MQSTPNFTLCGFWEANESGYVSMAWVSRDFANAVVESIGGPDPETMMGICMAQVSLYSDKDIEGNMDRILAELGHNRPIYAICRAQLMGGVFCRKWRGLAL